MSFPWLLHRRWLLHLTRNDQETVRHGDTVLRTGIKSASRAQKPSDHLSAQYARMNAQTLSVSIRPYAALSSRDASGVNARNDHMTDLRTRRTAFRKLHQAGCFVIPNPWDIGTARYLGK